MLIKRGVVALNLFHDVQQVSLPIQTEWIPTLNNQQAEGGLAKGGLDKDYLPHCPTVLYGCNNIA